MTRARKRKSGGSLPMYAACVLFFMTMFSICWVSGLYARYSVKVQTADTARVAIMASDVKLTVTDHIPLAPGEISKFPIEISNYHGSTVCEVEQRYTMSYRRLEDNLPLQCQLYSDEACSIEAAGTGHFLPDMKQSDYYWLKVSWPAEDKDAAYAFEVDAIEITVSVEQID